MRHPQVLMLCEQTVKEVGNEHLLPFLNEKYLRNFEQDVIEELSLIIEKILIYPDGKLAIEFISGKKRKISSNKKIKVRHQRPIAEGVEVLPCLQCGALVEQDPKRKMKKFCCSACRMKWWNNHRDLSETGGSI